TRPEGLGGSRDAGPAVASPRPSRLRLRRIAATAVRAVQAVRGKERRVKQGETDSGIRVRAKSSSYNSRRNSRYNSRYNRNNGSRRSYLRPYCTYAPYSRYLRPRIRCFLLLLFRHEARRPKIKDTIDWLEKHAFFYRKIGSSYGPGPVPGPGPGPNKSTEHSYGTRPEGLRGSRDAGPAVAGPRPPYVTEAERHNNVGGGYGYGRTGRTGHTATAIAIANALVAIVPLLLLLSLSNALFGPIFSAAFFVL
ncbi:hypothetical protein L249_4255, partial [Ophiocordyceps polyrhachis-furcata BCC 54312]